MLGRQLGGGLGGIIINDEDHLVVVNTSGGRDTDITISWLGTLLTIKLFQHFGVWSNQTATHIMHSAEISTNQTKTFDGEDK